jgi:hypothetical protein
MLLERNYTLALRTIAVVFADYPRASGSTVNGHVPLVQDNNRVRLTWSAGQSNTLDIKNVPEPLTHSTRRKDRPAASPR